jgi:heme/copper-type cytochrome/quinol oxidase subunit 1
MTTIDTHVDAAGEPATASVVGSFFAGVGTWATTTDHKKIGRLYLGFGLFGLLAASLVGALVGAERMGSGDVFERGAMLQIIQSYRLGLIFAGLIPVALGLAIAVAPLQLGARQIAFPRLALTGCYAWLGGLALTIAALGRNGGFGGGDPNAADLFLAGHGLMILGLLASAGSVAASVLTTRAPGMTMRRVPLFAWSCLISALGMLLALPVVFGAIIYLFIDHRLGLGENFGGVEGMGDWLSWVYSMPVAVVFALPAVGVAAELMPVTFRHRMPMRGVAFAGIALVGVTALAAVTQQADGHPVSFDSDQTFGDFLDGALSFLIFAGLPLLGLLITMGLGALTAKNGVANGRPRLTAAFVFSFLGLGLVLLGVNALMNIADLELAGTSFEEGATLLVVNGAVMAVLGGVLFWAAKLWGKVVPEKLAFPLVLPALAGAALSGLPLCIAGLLDQVGGVPSTDAQAIALLDTTGVSGEGLWSALSMVGLLLVVLTVVAVALLLVQTALSSAETAPQNPFGGHTVEWSTSSPAPADNYEYVPTVASATPQFDMTYEGSLP